MCSTSRSSTADICPLASPERTMLIKKSPNSGPCAASARLSGVPPLTASSRACTRAVTLGLWLMSISTRKALSSARPARSMMAKWEVRARLAGARTGPLLWRCLGGAKPPGIGPGSAAPAAAALASARCSGVSPWARSCLSASAALAALRRPCSTWPPAVAACQMKSGIFRVVLRHPGQFVQRGAAGGHLAQAILVQAQHAALHGHRVQDVRIAPFDDRAAQGIVEQQQFMDAGAATVARLAAMLAAHVPVHRLARRAKARQTCALAYLGPGVMGLLAMLAQRAHQPLGQHAIDGGGDEVGLDPHVLHPDHRAGGGVGVQGREHEVAGERRLHGDLRGLAVAHFAD